MIYESLIHLLPLAPVHPLRHCNTTIAKLLHKEKEDNIQLLVEVRDNSPFTSPISLDQASRQPVSQPPVD